MLALDVDLAPFRPPVWARGGHTQTLFAYMAPSPRLPGWGWKANEPDAKQADQDRLDQEWRIPVSGGDTLVGHFFEGRKPVVVYLFHGLGGQSHGTYMQRAALVALDLGYSALVCNHRGCGLGAGLAREPYHSGRSDDLSMMIAEGRRRFPSHRHVAVGFSLSANATLLLAAGERVPPEGRLPDAAMAVNAPIELDRASEMLTKGLNRIYDATFMHELRRHVEVAVQAPLKAPALDAVRKLGWLATCRDFDAAYTAPAGGFLDRADYYAKCSAFPKLAKIRIPTVVLTSEDDPFVPVDSYRRARFSDFAHVRIEPSGGHLGYWSGQATPLGTHRWLDWALHEYVRALAEFPERR